MGVSYGRCPVVIRVSIPDRQTSPDLRPQAEMTSLLLRLLDAAGRENAGGKSLNSGWR